LALLDEKGSASPALGGIRAFAQRALEIAAVIADPKENFTLVTLAEGKDEGKSGWVPIAWVK
jgi:hypothetical protein